MSLSEVTRIRSIAESSERSSVVIRTSKQSLACKLIVTFLIMLSIATKNGLVQSFKSTSSYRGLFRHSPLSYSKLVDRNSRQFTSTTLFSDAAGSDEKKAAAQKKKTSMLTRASKVLTTRAAIVKTEPEVNSFIIDSNPDMKMTKKVQEDMIADYARTVSRIPTSIKAKKVPKESSAANEVEVSKKYAPKYTPSPASTSTSTATSTTTTTTVRPTAVTAAVSPSSGDSVYNSNSMYTNTEYASPVMNSQRTSSRAYSSSAERSEEGSDEHSGEEIFENSQLTTHVTNMAFNSLDVSENTKRALSEVMNYK